MTQNSAIDAGDKKLDQVYTVPEVARLLKLSKSNLYKLVQSEQIPHIRIGKSIRIRHSDLEAWLDEQTQH